MPVKAVDVKCRIAWKSRAASGPDHRSIDSRAPRRDGFTLIELLVSTAVIAVLLGVLLPALARGRDRARILAMQVNQRECANVILQYTNDARGVFPSFGIEGTMIAPLEWKGQLVETRWWAQIEYWGLFLSTRGYDGWISMGPEADGAIFDRMSCSSCGQGRAVHLLMAAAFASPEQFTPGGADSSDFHWVQRVETVGSPSHKGLLLHLRGLAGRVTPVAFCDGHGELLSISTMAPGADTDLPFAPLPVVHTQRGVRGRDR